MRRKVIGKLVIIVLWVIFCGLIYWFSKEGTTKEVPEEPTKDESSLIYNLDTIRVLIKTSDYKSIYHDTVVISGTNGLEVENVFGKNKDWNSEEGYYSEQNLEIVGKYNSTQNLETVASLKSIFFDENKVVVPLRVYSPNNGQLILESVDRCDKVSYRGSIELYKTDKGIVVINELPLDEYLYGVVPSEMPSSYPLEALKAQAISARTYAVYHASEYAYPEWKAHVDDSTSYQVYKNIGETDSTTKAVDETSGIIVTCDNQPIESFYYSTSCGLGTGYEAWGSEEVRDYLKTNDFLRGTKMERDAWAADSDTNFSNGEINSEVSNSSDIDYMIYENQFREFIDYGKSDNVEFNEPWYRWQYDRNLASEDEIKLFVEHIWDVYQNNSDKVVISMNTNADNISTNDEAFIKENTINSIEITKRLSSGLADELTIQTKHYTVVGKTQHVIRQILAKSGDKVTKKDDSEFVMGDVLPSAYIYIDTTMDGDRVTRLLVCGGGLGHGVGMSQNGAKCLANLGEDAISILKEYYANIDISFLR